MKLARSSEYKRINRFSPQAYHAYLLPPFNYYRREIVVDDLQIAKRTVAPTFLPTASPTAVSTIIDETEAPSHSVSYSFL